MSPSRIPDKEAAAGLIASRWARKLEEQKPAVRERFRAIFRTLGEPFTEVDVSAHALVEVLGLDPFLTSPERPLSEGELVAFVAQSRLMGLRAFSAYLSERGSAGGGGLLLFPGLRKLVIVGEEHTWCGEDVGLLAGVMALDFAPEGLAAPARANPAYARELGALVWDRLRPPVS